MNQTQLAQHLNLTTRRIRQLEAIGVIIPVALGDIDRGDMDHGKYDPNINEGRYERYLKKDQGPMIIEIEGLTAQIEQALKRLQKHFSLTLAVKIAYYVRALDHAWMLSMAMRHETEQPLLNLVRSATIDGAMSAIFDETLAKASPDEIEAAAIATQTERICR